jgi:hypothetical protein
MSTHRFHCLWRIFRGDIQNMRPRLSFTREAGRQGNGEIHAINTREGLQRSYECRESGGPVSLSLSLCVLTIAVCIVNLKEQLLIAD